MSKSIGPPKANLIIVPLLSHSSNYSLYLKEAERTEIYNSMETILILGAKITPDSKSAQTFFYVFLDSKLYLIQARFFSFHLFSFSISSDKVSLPFKILT